jgi:hypothetical protein
MTKKKEVIEAEVVEETPHQERFDMVETGHVPATQKQFTPMGLINQGVASGAGMETMERLFALQVKHEENESKKAYFKAFAAFKSEAIAITKDKTVDFTGQGGRVVYDHATIGNVINTISPFLSKHGLSLNWNTVQNGAITVTCTLTHELGYSQSTSLTAGKDSSGKKNEIQQVASTQTYLQRHTALSITGLATSDQKDDDGKGSEEPHVDVISDSQYCDLVALIEDVKANEMGFCAHFGIPSVEMLPASSLKGACQMLEAKRKGGA